MIIYCLYHTDYDLSKYRHFTNDITFVKLGNKNTTLKFGNSLNISEFPNFKVYGKDYAEYEFFFNLYEAHLNNHYQIPEYFGTIQYDMDIFANNDNIFNFIKSKKLEEKMVISFNPRSCREQLKNDFATESQCFKKIISEYNKKFNTSFNEIDILNSGFQMTMASAFFMHRNIFISIMEWLYPIRDSFKRYDKIKRISGQLLERYLAVFLLLQNDLTRYNFDIPHHYGSGWEIIRNFDNYYSDYLKYQIKIL